jgi:hypothetical protein
MHFTAKAQSRKGTAKKCCIKLCDHFASLRLRGEMHFLSVLPNNGAGDLIFFKEKLHQNQH